MAGCVHSTMNCVRARTTSCVASRYVCCSTNGMNFRADPVRPAGDGHCASVMAKPASASLRTVCVAALPFAGCLPLAKGNACRPYGRLNVVIGEEDPLAPFAPPASTHPHPGSPAITSGHFRQSLACLPLLRLRGKSTRQNHGTPIFYVDLTVPTAWLKLCSRRARRSSSPPQSQPARPPLRLIHGAPKFLADKLEALASQPHWNPTCLRCRHRPGRF